MSQTDRVKTVDPRLRELTVVARGGLDPQSRNLDPTFLTILVDVLHRMFYQYFICPCPLLVSC